MKTRDIYRWILWLTMIALSVYGVTAWNSLETTTARVILAIFIGPTGLYFALFAMNLVSRYRPGPANKALYYARFAMPDPRWDELTEDARDSEWNRDSQLRPSITPLRSWKVRDANVDAFLCEDDAGHKISLIELESGALLSWAGGLMFLLEAPSIHGQRTRGPAFFRRLEHDWVRVSAEELSQPWNAAPLLPSGLEYSFLRCDCGRRRVDAYSAEGKLAYVMELDEENPVARLRIQGFFWTKMVRQPSYARS